MREHLKNRLWGVSALLLGLVGLAYTGWILVLAATQNSWIPAAAQVTESRVTRTTKGSGFTTNTSSHFSYQYEVAGKTHIASRYSFWSASGGGFEATQRYQVGDRITIHHHPTRHEIAVVEIVQPSVFVWVIVAFSLVFSVRGAVMVKTGKAAG